MKKLLFGTLAIASALAVAILLGRGGRNEPLQAENVSAPAAQNEHARPVPGGPAARTTGDALAAPAGALPSAEDQAGEPSSVAPAIQRQRDAPPDLTGGSVMAGGSEGCFEVTLRHKAMAGHPDRQHCSRHRNLIVMGAPKELSTIAWKSVCLRVDGVATPFERAPNGIAFGPLAGPGSRVTLRYCRGKATCPSDCAPPRDEFLEAIGASLKREKGAPTAVAKWDPSDAEDDPDPTAELEAELKENGASEHGLAVFKDWSPITRVPGCGTAVARVN